MGGHRTAQRKPNTPDNEDEDNSSLDWAMMGRNALARSRRVPMVSLMLGSLSIEQKKRATVKRAKLEKNDVDAKKPQEIKEEIANKLEESGKINLFRFFINPKEFAQSVENLFYLSFLIRDGKVAVSLDDEDSGESGEPKPIICEQQLFVSGDTNTTKT
uniref:Non-structural maintenance of chromosomes element 4 n=1 Tax=Moniliophthora roreri TaxID=221103 RepID=A0A0W0FDT7_MONRR